jgi:hypothetical protein
VYCQILVDIANSLPFKEKQFFSLQDIRWHLLSLAYSIFRTNIFFFSYVRKKNSLVDFTGLLSENQMNEHNELCFLSTFWGPCSYKDSEKAVFNRVLISNVISRDFWFYIFGSCINTISLASFTIWEGKLLLASFYT